MSHPASGRITEGILRPVEYARSARYRKPPEFYRRVQGLSRLLTRLGLVAPYVVTLEVPGRRSGIIRSTAMVRVAHGGEHYVVALAGESDWVRNVRAAGGRAVLGQRRRYAVRLVEVPPPERVAVIRAYLHRPGLRGVPISRTGEARHYFGIDPDAPPAQIERVVERYPVFRVDRA